MLLLIKKHIDKLIEQTKMNSQKFKLDEVPAIAGSMSLARSVNKHMQIVSFSPPKNYCAEGKWLLAVTNSEDNNTVSESLK